MDAVEALTRLGGLGTRGEVLTMASRHSLSRALLDGRVVRLKPGTYAASITATDAAGNRSRVVRVKFTVLKGYCPAAWPPS